MRMLKFAKYDWRIFKSQTKLLAAFLVLTAYMAFATDGGAVYGVLYGGFASIIFTSTPFYYEQAFQNSRGFIGMLPGTVAERVHGRFLFGNLAIIGYTGIAGALLMGITIALKKPTDLLLEAVILIMGVTCFFNALQFTLMYFIEMKPGHQTTVAFMRMIVPFAMFFGLPIIQDLLPDSAVAGTFRFWSEHSVTASLLLLLAALGFSVLMGGICIQHEKRKYE